MFWFAAQKYRSINNGKKLATRLLVTLQDKQASRIKIGQVGLWGVAWMSSGKVGGYFLSKLLKI